MWLDYLLGGNRLQEPYRLETNTIPDAQLNENLMLEARLDALELGCAGLWQFLKTKNGYTDEELVRVIQELDARDGKLDGRENVALANCPSCGRRLATRQRKRCIWCGAELAGKPF